MRAFLREVRALNDGSKKMIDPIQIRLTKVIHDEMLHNAAEARRYGTRPIGMGLIERLRSALSVPANSPAKLTHATPRKANS